MKNMNVVTNLQATSNSLEQFYQELLKSPDLQAKLKEASDPESLCQMVVQLGNEMGYSFTIEQVRAALSIEVAIGDVIEEDNLSTRIPTVAIASNYCDRCKK